VCDLSSVMPFNEDCAHAALNQAKGSPEAVAFAQSRATPNGACYNVVGANGRRFLVQPLPLYYCHPTRKQGHPRLRHAARTGG